MRVQLLPGLALVDAGVLSCQRVHGTPAADRLH